MTEDEKTPHHPMWVSPTQVRDAHKETAGAEQHGVPIDTVASNLASAAVSASDDDDDDDDLDDGPGWAPTTVLGWGILLCFLLAVFLVGRLLSC